MRRIYHHSRGVPRRINLLCDRSLLGAYARGSARVDAAVVDAAAKEVFDAPKQAANERSGRQRAALVGLGLIAGAGLVGAALLALDHAGRRTTNVDVASVANAAPAPQAAVPPVAGPVQPPPAEAAPAAAAVPALDDAQPAATPFDLASGFESLVGAEKAAWRELARAWSLDLGTSWVRSVVQVPENKVS